ncbi:MAG TPA: hypothetical protein VIT45_17405 [Allosphingosinicella sp.]
MKKIAIALVAVATLGVAACDNSANEAANNAVDVNVTENDADVDVNGAAAAAAGNEALDSVGNTIENAADAVGDAAEDAGNAVENAVD